MKTQIKEITSRIGIFFLFDLIRRLPECIVWVRKGAGGIAPPPIKQYVIASYLKQFNLGTFIETGTLFGDTLALVAKNSERRCISIELDGSLYQKALRRFSDYPNVQLLQGDSGVLIPKVMAELHQPSLFWLDGHYSGGVTAMGDLETPISAELQAILASPVQGHVILIDDVRCFDGSHDYPYLDELLSVIRADGRYRFEVSADILRLTPIASACIS